MTFDMLSWVKIGEVDLVICKKIRCIIIKPKITKGKRKWRRKKNLNVAWLIQYPAQIQRTIISPIKGIALTKLVITVAPQKDICPQGKTYPKKAVIITNNNKHTPLNQTKVNLKEL